MDKRRYDSDNETIYEQELSLIVDLEPELDLKQRKKKCWTAIRALPNISMVSLWVKYRGGMMETVHCELCNKDIERVKPDWEDPYEVPEQLIGAYQFELVYTLRASYR